MAERGRPLFSIGAVARMLDLSAATIRTWETRYGDVVPKRSQGGQRLYSRDQVDQLRFVKDEVASGRRPAEAHRLLHERLARGESSDGSGLRLLLAESGFGAPEILRQLLGSAADRLALDDRAPVVLVDASDGEFEDLASRLRAAGVKVSPLDNVS
jgi:DNA-binding transcriptional MerR regulator